MNYIKRLIGLPGETIAVYYGDLYVTRDLKYENRVRPTDPEQQRDRDAMYENDAEATRLLRRSYRAPWKHPAAGLE